MRIICLNRVSRRDWIIAVSLDCFVSLRTSFHTNWYHLMPSTIHRHHWLSVSILRAFVLDIAQQSELYRNIGKMHVLYLVEMASRDLQIWFSKLCVAARVMAGGYEKMAIFSLYLRNGTRYRHSFNGITLIYSPYSKVSFRMILSDLEWLSEMFNDTKHRAVSLRQLSSSRLEK